MRRRVLQRGRGHRRSAGRCGSRKPLRPWIEWLEDRTLLDSTPPAIVVGRTLSAYFVAAVQNSQETITYTVYNERADDETGVLLTTTLEPGVTFQSASQPPDMSGQNLAWSLGTIAGYDRASVTLTVSLASPTPTQLDSGAQAFATLDAGAVTAMTPAATLSTATPPVPSLLASTPDANTTDPFIQEEAAALDYDPTQIFNFLHTQIGYNSYTGSVRGARGTLWSSAGNALDVASLGVALMRASGIRAQYVQGTIPENLAQPLVRSMFPASYQTVGTIAAGTTISDPANDAQLLVETESHDWFQFNTGSGMRDADPLMAGATIGQTFTTATGTFAAVPGDLEETTEVQLVAEMYNQAAADFGFNPFQNTTVLDQTFDDVQLVGKPLTIGNFVSSSSVGGLTFTSARQGMAPPENVSVDPAATPIITPFDLTNLNILPGIQSPGAATLAQEHATQESASITAETDPTQVAQTEALIAIAQPELANFAVTSDQEAANLSSAFSVAAYFDAPRITALSSKLVTNDNQSTISLSLDLMHDSIRALGTPGQNVQAPLAFASARGIFDSLLEGQAFPSVPGAQSSSSAAIIQQSLQQGIPLATIDASHLSLLQSFELPADAIARITTNVQNGLTVIVPTEAVTVDGTQTTAWFNFNPTTGEEIAESEDGGHQVIATYAAGEEDGSIRVT